jgi:hypothetical protein
MVTGTEILVVERRSAGVSNHWRRRVLAGFVVFQTRTET